MQFLQAKPRAQTKTCTAFYCLENESNNKNLLVTFSKNFERLKEWMGSNKKVQGSQLFKISRCKYQVRNSGLSCYVHPLISNPDSFWCIAKKTTGLAVPILSENLL